MVKKRVPFQVSPEFDEKIKMLRRKKMRNGEEVSLIELTKEIAMNFDIIEKRLLEHDNIKMDIRLRMDKRR